MEHLEIAEIQRQWITDGHTTCVFARLLSAQQKAAHWLDIVNTLPINSHIGDRITEIIDKAIEKQYGSVQVLFPDITSQELLFNLITNLCNRPASRWYCVKIEDNPNGNSTLKSKNDPRILTANLDRGMSELAFPYIKLGLRWILPCNTKVNWTLGFANLECMPPTRRSPYTSLFLRVGAPGRVPSIALSNPQEVANRRLEYGRIPVHAADMDALIPNNKIINTWIKTRDNKQKYLKNHFLLDAAKARVTFTLPSAYAVRLESVFSSG